MPKHGAHPRQKLTAAFVKQTKNIGRHCDGNGLYLVVEPSSAKRWIVRLMVNGRRTDMGLGSTQLVPLAEAREKALSARKLAREGNDPLQERRKLRRQIPTFKEAAEQLHQELMPTFKNAKHGAQWLQTLKTYAFPVIAERSIDSLETRDILHILQPIWLQKPETARRIKQRLVKLLDWAKAHGHLTGDNVALKVHEVLPRQPAVKGHHSAIPYQTAPQFVQLLRGDQGSESTNLGLELIALTALRTNEVRCGKWDEINWIERTWKIPPERQQKLKIPKELIVPLSPRCVEILQRLRALSASSTLIFPGREPHKPVGNMTFLTALKRLGYEETVHGFRAAFRTWASEETNHSSEVIEAALGHTIRNKVEAAYRRGDLLEKRRLLMDDWADYLAGVKARTGQT